MPVRPEGSFFFLHELWYFCDELDYDFDELNDI